MASAVPPEPSGRRPRADSLRNRERLLTAAQKAFLSLGDEASLEAIAKDAGVGIGTLYRHFPSRESLVAAVYEGELATVTTPGLVDELVARDGNAAQALRSWMDQYATFVATKHGMSDALRAGMASGDVRAGRTRQLVNSIVGAFLAAGAADGSLRADRTADVVTTALVGVLWSLGRTDPDQQPDQTRQLLDLIVDGLRTNSSD